MATKCNRCGVENNEGRFCTGCGALLDVATSPDDPFIGLTISDRYQIVELISAGGMGRVYRAKQALLDREVALKVIHPHLLTTDQIVARFLAEARMSSRLNHPNVVSIYDFGRTSDAEGGHLYLVMELLAGRSLSTMIAAGETFSLKRVSSIMRQMLAALGEAHAIGITHRDVKPDNVLIAPRRDESDHVKVIDFGIARAAGDARLSQAGQLVGTPHYMAPETLTGKLGPSVDLYAAGIVLFEMLAGVVPFDDESIPALFTMHTTAPRPDPRTLAPGRNIPAALAEVALRAIEIEVAARYATAEELSAAIEDAVRSSESLAPTKATATATTTSTSTSTASASARASKPRIEPAASERASKADIREDWSESTHSMGRAPTVKPPSMPDVSPLPSDARAAAPLIPSQPPAVRITPARRDSREEPPSRYSQEPPLPREEPGSRYSQEPRARRTPASPRKSGEPPKQVSTPPRVVSEVPRSTPSRARVTSERPKIDAGTLIERDELLSTVWQRLEMQPDDPHVLWGRGGIGKSALLERLLAEARRLGRTAVHVSAPPQPRNEVGCSALRAIVAGLLGLRVDDPDLCAGRVAPDERTAKQTRLLFEPNPMTSVDPGSLADRDGSGVLRWAARQAVERAKDSRVLLALDDADKMDLETQSAIARLLDGGGVPGLTLVMTGERAPDAPIERRIAATRVSGLSAASAVKLHGKTLPVNSGTDDIEPMYVLQLRQWPEGFAPPTTLADLLEHQVRALPAAQRRVMQAIAILGSCTQADLANTYDDLRERIPETISQLTNANLVRADGVVISPAHGLVVRPAVDSTPAPLRSDLHRRASDALATSPKHFELRAYHAVRAGGDAASYQLVAQAAELRACRGNHAGVVAVLLDAMQRARAQTKRGDAEGSTTAWMQFARSLVPPLIALDRSVEAVDVLQDALVAAPAGSAARALILRQLAAVASHRGRTAEADTFQREALETALQTRDAGLVDTISTIEGPLPSGRSRRPLFASPTRGAMGGSL